MFANWRLRICFESGRADCQKMCYLKRNYSREILQQNSYNRCIEILESLIRVFEIGYRYKRVKKTKKKEIKSLRITWLGYFVFEFSEVLKEEVRSGIRNTKRNIDQR